MIVPAFWAEARVQQREKGKQVTVRRFGWSQTSEAEAQANAQTRAEEALRKILAGELLDRRERKVPYNGAEGVPIREEIVAQHGEVIITRNSYGALCLNTPDVLFADVDFLGTGRAPSAFAVMFGLGCLSLGAGWYFHSVALLYGLVLGSAVLAWPLAVMVRGLIRKLADDAERLPRERIAAFSATHPDWRLRVYRTPAGFRVLAMHRPFSPSEPAVAEFFSSLGTDPVYVTMCQRQNCFRARVSPKPWRIGIEAHLKPQPGTWPVRPEALPARRAWVEAYHAKAANFASCRFENEFGNGTVDERVQSVQTIHDQLCRAESDLPTA